MPAAQPSNAVAAIQARGRKEYPAGMRYVVIAMLVLIVASLGSALFYMMRGRDDPRKMARALAIRVGLSVGLFVLLMAGWFFGLWQPGRL
jgi:Na+-driven multidrug efflux pump